LIEQRSDIHHIFPKKYLQKNSVNNCKDYNQITNYVYTQSEIKIKIKDAAPCEYMDNMKKQVTSEGGGYGSITAMEDFEANLAENCIPVELMNMGIFDYVLFLDTRRLLISEFVRDYYKRLD
jgi:hypothetical protein